MNDSLGPTPHPPATAIPKGLNRTKVLGERLKDARLKASITQEELQEAAGLCETIRQAEEGQSPLTWEQAVEAAIILNVSLDYLAGAQNDEPVTAPSATLGEKIKAARLRLGMSQRQMAEAIGLETISKLRTMIR